MRELTQEELDLISGGYDSGEDIVVTGSPYPPPYYPPPYYPPSYPPPSSGGGGGGGGSMVAATDNNDRPCADGAAKSVGEHIKEILATPNDTDYEYGAFITRNGDGSYGAYKDAIRTSNSTTSTGLGEVAAGDWTNLVGAIHNHPWNSSDYNENFNQRYPSTEDWGALDRIASEMQKSNPSANVGDLSLYLVDPWGTVREYKYSDKAALEALTDSDRKGPNNPMLGSEVAGCS